MHIEKIEVKGFGKLNNLSINLSKGMNIVYGSNESGKSSLQAFIKAMFFGLKGGRVNKDGALPALKKYKPWKSEDYSGFIQYMLDDGQVYRVGRNFGNNSVKVYDSLFNDITNTFDSSRDKGVMFAEKHLGVNEACFEKTVFIKQLGTRLEDDRSKELLNKLANLHQTGFEDISLKKAQEALKEALKLYVGTDKTTVRPLDKVIERLSEVYALKRKLNERREQLQDFEMKLKELRLIKVQLEEKKQSLADKKQIIDIESSLQRDMALSRELKQIRQKVIETKAELDAVCLRIEETLSIRDGLELFSEFSTEDVEDITVEFYKLSDLKAENTKLEHDSDIKNETKRGIELGLEPLKPFYGMDTGVNGNLAGLKRDIDALKDKKDKNNIHTLNEKLQSAGLRKKTLMYGMVSTAVGAFLFAALGMFLASQFYFAALVCFAVLAGLVLFSVRNSRYLSQLDSERQILNITANGINEELSQKLELFDTTLKSVGAESLEDFLNLHSSFERKLQQLADINTDIFHLQQQLITNTEKIDFLKNKINRRLLAAGLINALEHEPDEKLVKDFCYGVRRLKELEPVMNYDLKRREDLYSGLTNLYMRAGEASNTSCADMEKLQGMIGTVEKSIVKWGNMLDTMDSCSAARHFDTACAEHVESRSETYSTALLETDYTAVIDELNDMNLKIKEYETLIKSGAGDIEDIQKADEEIEELETRKKSLEDTGFSLKIALEVLNEASMEVEKDYVPAINSRMGSIIDCITAGRYSELKAGDNLSLKVITPETGDIVPAVLLSGGTIDQAYLAMRISMAEMIASSGEKLPLIMDEIFAQYDDLRTIQTLTFLYELSNKYQIIILTCKKREIEMVKEVCNQQANIIELY